MERAEKSRENRAKMADNASEEKRLAANRSEEKRGEATRNEEKRETGNDSEQVGRLVGILARSPLHVY